RANQVAGRHYHTVRVASLLGGDITSQVVDSTRLLAHDRGTGASSLNAKSTWRLQITVEIIEGENPHLYGSTYIGARRRDQQLARLAQADAPGRRPTYE